MELLDAKNKGFMVTGDSPRKAGITKGESLLNIWFSKVFRCLVFGIWCFISFGCQTAAPLPPLDFKEPGWKIRQGQAVWKPKREAPELAGEILIAFNSDGRTAVQFTKTPFPFVVARTTSATWQLEIPAKNKRYSGHGKPPVRAGWLFLAQSIEGTPPPLPWKFQKLEDSNWRLENTKTGEVIEGFVNP